MLLLMPEGKSRADQATPEKSDGVVGSTPSASEPSDEVQVSLSELSALLQEECKRWQAKLRLQDWNVTVVLCRLNEMPKNPKCGGDSDVGCTMIYESSKDAIIYLLAPIDFPGMIAEPLMNDRTNYDITLVHELMHLHFQPFEEPDESPKGIMQEQVINVLSRAIVEAHTKPQGPHFPLVKSSSAGFYV